MSAPTRVACVIPTYNRSHVVKQAIESALAQNDVELEVIVVDDASTDGTVEELTSVFGRAIRVIDLPANTGGAYARNAGIAASDAPFVAFLDDDDVWYADKIKTQLDYLESTGGRQYGACYCCGLTDDGGVVGTGHEGDFRLKLLRGEARIGSSSALLYRRAVLEAVGGFTPTLRRHQDIELVVRTMRQAKMGCTPVVLYNKRYVSSPPVAALAGSLTEFFEVISPELTELSLMGARYVRARDFWRVGELAFAERRFGLAAMSACHSLALNPRAAMKKSTTYLRRMKRGIQIGS